MAEKKKSAGKASQSEIDVFEAYEAKHKKAKAKKSGAAKKSAKKRKKNGRGAWWAWPVTIVMIVILSGLSATAMREKSLYDQFVVMREAVNVSGYYPGVSIDGRDVTGRMLNDVLAELAAQDQAVRDSLVVTVNCGGRTWTVTATDLNYTSDYQDVARAAWKPGHEGNISERYQAIRRLQSEGANYVISRSYDETLLRKITDKIADDMSFPAQDAQIIAFDTDTREFSFSSEKNGVYVDAERLYQDVLAAIRSGAGGQTVTAAREAILPTVKVADIQDKMGLMASARTFVEGDKNSIRQTGHAERKLFYQSSLYG